MTISLTERAAERVKTFMASKQGAIGLRIGIKKTGCSGYAYVIDYAENLSPGDKVHDSHGVSVIVNDQWAEILAGIEVDFVREGLNSGFKFHNPNIKGECGCGESFTV